MIPSKSAMDVHDELGPTRDITQSRVAAAADGAALSRLAAALSADLTARMP